MQDPLNRVVIIQKVATFAARSLPNIIQLCYVNDSWADTVKNYAFHLFEQLVRVDHILTCRSVFLRALECDAVWLVDVLCEFFLCQRKPAMIYEEAPDLGENKGDTPLGYAARKNRKEIVKIMLDRSSPVNLYDHEGLNAFHRAVMTGDADLVSIFLEHSKKVSSHLRDVNDKKKLPDFVKINAVTEKEESPLLLAVRKISEETNNNSDNDNKYEERRRIISMIMNTPKCQIDAKDEDENNILHILAASSNNNTNAHQLLRDLLIIFNRNKNCDDVVLFIKDEDLRKEMFLTDPRESVKNAEGNTPFAVACKNKNYEACKIFIDATFPSLIPKKSQVWTTLVMNTKLINLKGESPVFLALKNNNSSSITSARDLSSLSVKAFLDPNSSSSSSAIESTNKTFSVLCSLLLADEGNKITSTDADDVDVDVDVLSLLTTKDNDDKDDATFLKKIYDQIFHNENKVLLKVLQEVADSGNYLLLKFLLRKIILPQKPSLLNTLYNNDGASDDGTFLLHHLVRQQTAKMKKGEVENENYLKTIDVIIKDCEQFLDKNKAVTSRNGETVIHECVRFAPSIYCAEKSDNDEKKDSTNNNNNDDNEITLLEILLQSSSSSSSSSSDCWDLEKRNYEGDTAVLVAAKTFKYHLIPILKKYGANIRVENGKAGSAGRNLESYLCAAQKEVKTTAIQAKRRVVEERTKVLEMILQEE